jgi:hypothetical protein
VYIGTFEDNEKHGLGNLFDPKNDLKQREEYVKGVRKSFVRSTTTGDELQRHLQNPGYKLHYTNTAKQTKQPLRFSVKKNLPERGYNPSFKRQITDNNKNTLQNQY